MADMAEAVNEFKRGRLSGGRLHRFILGYPHWRISLITGKDDTSKLGLFLAQRAGEESWAGTDVFGGDLSEFSSVLIEPGSTGQTEIGRDKFAAMRELAEALAIEAAWQRLARGVEQPDDLTQVAHYPRYQVAAINSPKGFLLIHVPHDNGGMFVPIFTHQDALEAARPDFNRNFARDKITCREIVGTQLFPPLVHEKAEGVVLNYLGPTEPIAFRLRAVGLIVAALGPR